VDGISLPATRDSVAEVGRRIVALGQELGLGPDESYRLRLATEEIVANVVAHGYPAGCGSAGEDPAFELCWGGDPERVWVCVVDNAQPFDPTAAAAPADLDSPLERRSPGGLGIHLVRNSLDEFRYRHDGRHNHVTLGVCRARPATDDTRNGGPDGPDGPDRL
jgi:anti-sigma regulatory factor (Ser/Thr protein kinase)